MFKALNQQVRSFVAQLCQGIMGFFAASLFILALFIGSITAHAATNDKAPPVPIHTIHFEEGRLVQDLQNFDIWTEYDFRGTKRFTFKTLSYDKKTLRLQGQTGQVMFFIDFSRQMISGEWSGHPMAPLYRITKIDPFVIKNDVPKTPTVPSPVEQAPLPRYVPPNKTPPVVITPTKAPTPSTLKRAAYKGGVFEQIEGAQWVERGETGRVYNFRNIGYNDSSIFLYDTTRNVLIELDIPASKSRISERGEKLRTLYSLTKLSSEAAAPPVSEPTPTQEDPRVLSALDRALCTSKGGVVERAGMLGAERCTMSFSDGGSLCIDSSNCEGKCLTSANARGKDVVTGQCQKTDNPFGCFSEVLGGKMQPGLCVD